MKSLDFIAMQCMYAALLGAVALSIVHISVIGPKQARMNQLTSELARLERFESQTHEAFGAQQEASEDACAWEKNQSNWRINGKFSNVYECLLHEENQREVASMRFQKHMMGVSVELGFNEMPA